MTQDHMRQAKEITKSLDCPAACPIHGFEFITMSDGDGHPASWHDFCDHDDHEEPIELISGKEYLEKAIAQAIASERQKAVERQIEKDAEIIKGDDANTSEYRKMLSQLIKTQPREGM